MKLAKRNIDQIYTMFLMLLNVVTEKMFLVVYYDSICNYSIALSYSDVCFICQKL